MSQCNFSIFGEFNLHITRLLYISGSMKTTLLPFSALIKKNFKSFLWESVRLSFTWFLHIITMIVGTFTHKIPSDLLRTCTEKICLADKTDRRAKRKNILLFNGKMRKTHFRNENMQSSFRKKWKRWRRIFSFTPCDIFLF